MTVTNRITIGYVYQRCNDLFFVNMQSKTLKQFVAQSNEAIKNDSKHVVKWTIKKKIYESTQGA